MKKIGVDWNCLKCGTIWRRKRTNCPKCGASGNRITRLYPHRKAKYGA